MNVREEAIYQRMSTLVLQIASHQSITDSRNDVKLNINTRFYPRSQTIF